MKVASCGNFSNQTFKAKLSPEVQELASKTMYELRESEQKLGCHILQKSLKEIGTYAPKSTMHIERIFVDGKPRYEAFIKSNHIADKHLDIQSFNQDINEPFNVAQTFNAWAKALNTLHEKVKNILD